MHGVNGSLGWVCCAAVMLVAILGGCADKSSPAREIAGADPQRGPELMARAGCAACHRIPGVAWPQGTLGGGLEGFGAKPLIAGRFPNQPATLIAWLRNAPALAPDVAMPPSGLSAQEARDVAAYLYSLDER